MSDTSWPDCPNGCGTLNARLKCTSCGYEVTPPGEECAICGRIADKRLTFDERPNRVETKGPATVHIERVGWLFRKWNVFVHADDEAQVSVGSDPHRLIVNQTGVEQA